MTRRRACLGLSDEAVRVRLHRARHLLRGALYDRVGPAAPEVFAFAGERCDRIVRAVLARVLM
jgi:RNA polymerase sigma-70 factor (ECF subfamily)